MAETKKSKIQITCPYWYVLVAYILNQLIGACMATIGFIAIVFIIKNFEEVMGYRWNDLAFGLIGASIWMLIAGIAIIWKTNNEFIMIGKKERR